MAERNQLIKGIVSHNEARTGNATNTTYGTGGESYDEDYSTYYGIFTDHNSDGCAVTTFTGEHTWTDPVTISRVKCKLYAKAIAYGNYGQRELDFDIYIKQAGNWVSIYHKDNNASGTGTTEETNEQNLTTGWENITGVKVYCRAYAYSYEGNRAQDAYCHGYEVQAFYAIKKSFAGVV